MPEKVTKINSGILTRVNISDLFPIGWVVDGGGNTITTGVKGWVRVANNCIIKGWEVTCQPSGSITIDIYKSDYAGFPPTASLVGTGTKPSITSGTKNKGDVLTGWTTTLTAGDYLRINIESVTSITYLVLNLIASKT